jgi:hypothetical protein
LRLFILAVPTAISGKETLIRGTTAYAALRCGRMAFQLRFAQVEQERQPERNADE